MACETARTIPFEAPRKSTTDTMAHGTASTSTSTSTVPHESDRVSQLLDDASVDVSVDGSIDGSGEAFGVSRGALGAAAGEEALGSVVLDVMHDPWRVEGLDLQGPNYVIVRRTLVCPIQRADIPAGSAAGAATVGAEREVSPNESVVVGKRRRRRGKGRRATGEERTIGGERKGGREQDRHWEGASKAREGRPVTGAVSSSRGGGLARTRAGGAGIIRAADASESVECAAAGIAPGNIFAGRANRGARWGGVAEIGGGRGGAEREAEGGGARGEEGNGAGGLVVDAEAPHLSKAKYNVRGVSQGGAQIDGSAGLQGAQQRQQQQQEEEVEGGGEGEEEGEEEGGEAVGGSSSERGPGVWQAVASAEAPASGETAAMDDLSTPPEASATAAAAAAAGGGGGGGMAEDGMSGGAAGVGSVCAGRVVKGKGPGQYLFRAEDGEGFTSVDVGANGMSVVCNARGCRPVRVDESFVDRHGLPQSLSQLPNGAGRLAEGGGVGEMEGGDAGLGMGGVGEIWGGDVGESVWGEGGVVGGEAEDGGGVGGGGEGERERRPVGKGENGLAVVEGGGEAIMEFERREDERGARSGWDHGGITNGRKTAEGRDGGEAREGSNARKERDERNKRDERYGRDERESSRRSGKSSFTNLSAGVGLDSERRGGDSEREGGGKERRGGEEGAAVRGGTTLEGPAVGGRAAASVEEEDEQYSRAVRRDPTNALLLCDYARFLYVSKDDPTNALLLCDYARFLYVSKDDPTNALLLCDYARFLYVSKDDPTNALLLCDYARFLCEIKDYHRADEMFRRAVAASQAEGRARVKGRAAGMDQSPSSPTNSGGLKGLKGVKGAKGATGVKGVTGVEEGEVLVLWAKAVWEGWRDGERALALFDHAVEVAPHDCYVLAAYASFLWSVESASPSASTGSSSSSSSSSSSVSSASGGPLCLNRKQGQKPPSMSLAARSLATGRLGDSTSSHTGSGIAGSTGNGGNGGDT
ncbi:unnamed protein product [Closterium sp. Naga37s-1]|nr:unnamed protein product [Closterium sp. Naga37s-1]